MFEKPICEELEQKVKELKKELECSKQREKALKAAESYYRAFFEHGTDGVVVLDPETARPTDFNDQACRQLGYSREEFAHLRLPDIEANETDEEIRTHIQKVMENGFDNFETLQRTKQGEIRHVYVSAQVIDIAGRQVYHCIWRDITECKWAEEALRESEERYRKIFENIQDVYYETSTDGTILEVSPSIEKISQYKRSELVGKSLYDIYTNSEERDELLKTIIDSGRVANFEVHLTDKDGSQHSCEINTLLDRDQKGNPTKLIGSMRDITERKQFEVRLRQSRKMEAIGTLAGGIAHEFNNILTTIIGNTELAIGDIPERNPARECLQEIRLASLRAKDVVRQLLGFARKSVFQLQPVHLSPLIRDAMILIQASTPATIEIRQNLSCESDTVMADSSQIDLVFLNLCANARNAMQEKGGVLEVKLENTTLDETSASRYEDLSPGNYLKLTVKDSGHGIDPKIIDRVFDPYFTTTSLAEGTGMGLAVVHGIVKHHKGTISVASEPGKGTVFEVLFPLTEAEAKQKAGEPEALPTGNEKILFVDDEMSILKLAKKRLEMQGYQVETKSDPVEALELVRSEPDRFDLIITDMTMPKMTGDKLAKEILSIRPGMPIILCSGFSEKIDAEKARALGIRKYIEKPPNMSDFVIAVRKVLDWGLTIDD